jgi:hypothetical protein
VLTANCTAGVFAGYPAWGQFWVKNPAGTWLNNGARKDHVAGANGSFYGAFGDESGAFANNVGMLMVGVWEV